MMKSSPLFLWTVFGLAFDFGFGTPGMVDPPRLHPMTGQHELTPGEEFRLRCSGSRPVEWALPKDEAGSTLVSRTVIDEEKVSGSVSRPFITHLRVEQVHFLDTGIYICKFKVSLAIPKVHTTQVLSSLAHAIWCWSWMLESAREMPFHVIRKLIPCAPYFIEIAYIVIQPSWEVCIYTHIFWRTLWIWTTHKRWHPRIST